MATSESPQPGETPPPDAPKLRAFVALALEKDARSALAQAADTFQRQPWAKGMRWVRSEGLHLTLRFLGDTAFDAVPGLVDALGERLRQVEPFESSLRGLALFPSASRPRVVAALLKAEPALDALSAAVEEAVVAAGFPAQSRRFRAHITLGRFRRMGGRGLELNASLEEVPIAVNEVVLFRSTLGPGGARYSELGRAALAACGG
jgi:2'-5' RNA ligase